MAECSSSAPSFVPWKSHSSVTEDSHSGGSPGRLAPPSSRIVHCALCIAHCALCIAPPRGASGQQYQPGQSENWSPLQVPTRTMRRGGVVFLIFLFPMARFSTCPILPKAHLAAGRVISGVVSCRDSPSVPCIKSLAICLAGRRHTSSSAQPITLGHNAQGFLLVSQRLALHIAQD